ncbi:hypothetical protein ACHAWF_000935, partial [Thalassiosira exigua]
NHVHQRSKSGHCPILGCTAPPTTTQSRGRRHAGWRGVRRRRRSLPFLRGILLRGRRTTGWTVGREGARRRLGPPTVPPRRPRELRRLARLRVCRLVPRGGTAGRDRQGCEDEGANDADVERMRGVRSRGDAVLPSGAERFVSVEAMVEEIRGEFQKRPPPPRLSGSPSGFALSAAAADGALLIKNDASGRSVLRARLLRVRSNAAASVTLTNSLSLRRRIFAVPNRAASNGERSGRGSPRDDLSSLEAKGQELLANPPPMFFPPVEPPPSDSKPQKKRFDACGTASLEFYFLAEVAGGQDDPERVGRHDRGDDVVGGRGTGVRIGLVHGVFAQEEEIN